MVSNVYIAAGYYCNLLWAISETWKSKSTVMIAYNIIIAILICYSFWINEKKIADFRAIPLSALSVFALI